MNKNITHLRWLVTTLMLVTAMAMPSMASAAITPSKPANGDGTSSDPYQISNAAELYWFAELVNGKLTDGTAQNVAACAKLTENITVNSNVLNPDGTLNTANSVSFTAWTPMGSQFSPYTGTFNGDNHTISGLYFNDSSSDYVGLFGYNNGSIEDVGIIESYFNGKDYVGSVCGYNIVEWFIFVDGNTEASVENCYNTGTVSGNNYVGGVCGKNYARLSSSAKITMASVIITRCHNEGSVSGAGNVGGVCGENSAAAGSSGKISSADIQYCYNIGIVSGTETVGGVCGNNYAQATGGISTASIEYCHNTNAVISSGSVVGGVCGVNNSSSSSEGTANAKINRCYYNSDKYSGTAVSNNNCTNTEGRTTAQFKSGEVAYLLQQGEPFSKWGQTIGTDDYPVIGGAKVYYYINCTGEMVYSNQDGTADHSYINGNCIVCGAYQLQLQPAPKNGDVYEISNAGQLYWFAALVNGKLTDGTSQDRGANAKLMADIVVNKNVLNENGELNHTAFTSWTLIGYFNSLDDKVSYYGAFDGNGHTISGLYYNDSNGTHVGLFGLTGCSTLKNIGVVDSYFNGKNAVGGISGSSSGDLLEYAIIVNCYFTGSVSGSDNEVGGLCGYTDFSKITNCYYDSDKFTGNAIGTNHGTATNVEGKTTEQFKSGEVAYKLSQGCTIKNTFYDGSVWGQQIGVDNYPVHAKPGINTVYQNKILCGDVVISSNRYSNTKDNDVNYDHITSADDITFDSGKKIYSHSCQREGCGKAFYFADAAGSIAAIPNADETAFTIPSYTVTDATAYDSKAEFTATSLAYKRTFSNGYWQAVYVPFEIDCGKLPDDMEIAVVNNFHEYEQEDGSYNVVLEVKRKTSGIIPALTPCVIRMKTAPESATEKEIILTNVPFSAAEDKYIDCASVSRYYKFNGSLAGISAGNMVDGTDFVLNQGRLYKANEETTLKPQRWFLSATDRPGGSSSQASMLRSISINVVGDGDVTGIEDIHVVTEKVAPSRQGVFDLHGRRLNNVPARGIYIKNGIKYVK